MNAIIYAAGIGQRLQSQFGERPKILLEFGGRSLLEWHVLRLLEVGVRGLAIVTGYQREMLRAAAETLGKRHGILCEFFVNQSFTEGSVLSFAASISWLERQREPALLMDGDVLYPAEMLRRLIASPHRTVLLLDRDYSTADDDPVLVPVRDGRPFDFVKKWRGDAAQVGESIGFFKLDPADLPALILETRRRIDAGDRKASYDDVLRELVKAGRFGHEDVTALPWTEIDFPGDVLRANTEVLPAIEKLEG